MPRFFAPGKVVVAGEYAVVDGAPALVAAVDIGVAVDVTPADVATITTPTGDARFVRAAIDRAGVGPATWTFSDHGGPELASKPGLGGSAAATVVATFAAHAMGGTPDRDRVFAEAFAVHHAVQGSGSGIDVAASTYGGVLRYQPGAPMQSVAPPRLVVVWTGQSAKTGPRVQQYKAWAGREAFVAESAAIVDSFATDPIGALRANRVLLEGMADAAGIAYRTPELDAVVALAERFGGAAKASGAGGGDSAVAVLPDAASEAAFVAAVTDAGMVVLSAEVVGGVGAMA